MRDDEIGSSGAEDRQDADQDALLRAHHDRLERSAAVDRAFADALQHRIRQQHTMRDRRRWLFPVAAVALLAATLAGGAIAGVISGARDVAQQPSATPATSETGAAVDPSASVVATTAPTRSATPTPSTTPSVSPSGEPVSATPMPSVTSAPVATATAGPPAPRPLPFSLGFLSLTDRAVPGYAADSAVASDLRHYTFFWGSDQFEGGISGQTPVLVLDPRGWNTEIRSVAGGAAVSTDTQAVGAPDGLVYLFTPGAEGSSVSAYDPQLNVFVAGAEAFIDAMVFDAALASDGEIYLWDGSAIVYRYDRATETAERVAELSWSAAGMASNAEGRLVLPGPDGVGIYDTQRASWDVIASDAPVRFDLHPPITAGPDGAVLVASQEDEGVWFHDDGVWMFEPVDAVLAAVGYVDSHWVLMSAGEVALLRPGDYVYSIEMK